jgi:Cu/Ag efflux protein CusF
MKMRRAIVFAMFLTLSAIGWAQDAPDNSGSTPQAQQGMGQHQGRRWPGVAGTITAIGDNSLTLKTPDGQTAQVSVSDKTQFRKARQEAKLSDFKVGDNIFVRGEQKDGVWQGDFVAERQGGGFGGGRADFREGLGKQFIVGEVKAISGTQLTIARPDGVSQDITVDENTSFKKDGESVTLADLKVGDHVFGRGELKDNVFVPAVLNVGQPRFMRGSGGGAPPQ